MDAMRALIAHNAATYDTMYLLSSLAEAGKFHRPVHERRAAARLQAAWRGRQVRAEDGRQDVD